MAGEYVRGNSKQILVGAAALFLGDTCAEADIPTFTEGETYRDTLTTLAVAPNTFNVGYTSDGMELTFEPDFGEVNVDQILDVAKLFKQGMSVSLKTAFAEATLENLMISLAYPSSTLTGDALTTTGQELELSAGELGECPVERSIWAVGPGTGDCDNSGNIERVYIAYRALSIESVSASMKRDEASTFEVSFRLLPEGISGAYGKIVDRTVTTV